MLTNIRFVGFLCTWDWARVLVRCTWKWRNLHNLIKNMCGIYASCVHVIGMPSEFVYLTFLLIHLVVIAYIVISSSLSVAVARAMVLAVGLCVSVARSRTTCSHSHSHEQTNLNHMHDILALHPRIIPNLAEEQPKGWYRHRNKSLLEKS